MHTCGAGDLLPLSCQLVIKTIASILSVIATHPTSVRTLLVRAGGQDPATGDGKSKVQVIRREMILS